MSSLTALFMKVYRNKIFHRDKNNVRDLKEKKEYEPEVKEYEPEKKYEEKEYYTTKGKFTDTLVLISNFFLIKETFSYSLENHFYICNPF